MSKTYRFFTRELQQIPSSGQLRLGPDVEVDIFSQLTRVLRVAVGDTVVLLAGSGGAGGAGDDGEQVWLSASRQEHWFRVAAAHKKEVLLDFLEVRTNENELPLPLALILCVPNKPDKLSFILQKAVEVGVSEVALVQSDHSQMKHALRMDRLEKIVAEAAEQAERGVLPVVREGETLREWLAKEKNEGSSGGFFTCAAVERLDGGNGAGSLLEVLAKFPSGMKGVRLIVGPEGGFSPEEKTLLQKSAVCFTLGKRILRMETAIVAALATLAMRLEEK